MKKMRRLIPAFAMLLVAATMLSTASFAWFTMGTQADVQGMEVQAQAASALLIIDAEKLTGGLTASAETIYAGFKDATNLITLDANDKALIPATAYDGSSLGVDAEGEEIECTNGLMTLADFNKVNAVTGVADNAGYAAAVDTVNYIEYVVYLASGAGDMSTTGNTLVAYVSLPDGELAKYIDNALSIQFNVYDKTADTEAYTTTINFNEVAKTGTLAVDLKTAMIPNAFKGDTSNQLNDYVKVVMRVYYDGALVDKTITTETTTYVRNDKMVNLEDASAFNLWFKYEQYTATSEGE